VNEEISPVASQSEHPTGVTPVNDVETSPQTEVVEPEQQPEQPHAVIAAQPAKTSNFRELGIAAVLALAAGLAFYFSTKAAHHHFDYTSRIAGAFLTGHLGLPTHPGSWLNEMVPWHGRYYSVFPLGAVIAMIPVALMQKAGWIHEFPAGHIAALIAGLSVFFFFLLSGLESKSLARRILLALFPVFGTWYWCNVGFAGAWQLALGFALLGEAGALYFTLVKPRPLAAGAFFALAFGNRTELILTAPIFLYLLSNWTISDRVGVVAKGKQWFRQNWRPITDFLLLPVTLGLLTMAYNFARFGSFFDFGYTHIPNVLNEPWYQHGLFSLHAIPWNVHKMLFEGFGDRSTFPFVRLYPFGCSIFLSSPFLVLLFREGGRYKHICWIAIAILTLVLWMHGNPGGWQFSYRYAIILLPWMFLLLVGNGPTKLSVIEVSLFVVSVAINAVAMWQFLWTNEIHP
jgi:hypothetical protein